MDASGFGEGSMALADDLNIASNPRKGGVEDREIIYVVYPDAIGFPKNAAQVRDDAAKSFATWGGDRRLQACDVEIRKHPP